jgi:predicted thioesterase
MADSILARNARVSAMGQTDSVMSGRTLHPGLVGELRTLVTPEATASAYGNEGVDVLATPKLVHLMESASVLAIQDALQPSESTVGTRVEVAHLAATPIGMIITVRAILREIDGRRLTFDVEGRDEIDLVASGTHERVLIDLVRFLDRAKRKRSRASS